MHGGWNSSAHTNQFHTTIPDYLRFPASSMPLSLFSQLVLGTATATSDYNANTQCLSPSVFKAASAITHGQNTATVFPQQTHLESEDSSPMSYTISTCDQPHVYMPITTTQCASDSQQPGISQGSDSSQTSHHAQSLSTKQHRVRRKRKTDNVEPDSTRATYLKKNRKAASKCRSKQKKQQEDLVEHAREVERRNRCLKVEVALLQDGIRELLEMVEQHNACSDTRLTQYVQRRQTALLLGS
jgi:hypothetical protein